MDKKADNPKQYLTPNEVAERLMVSPVTVRHWALDGKLAFETTPGGHRRFLLEDVEAFANGRDKSSQPQAMRILLVDDNQALVGYLAELFDTLPREIVTERAYDGFEAGRKLMEFKPHAVVMDVMMPGLNGIEVCRSIKNSPATAQVRVIMMTGFPSQENTQQALEAGSVACLAKPLNKAQLFAALDID